MRIRLQARFLSVDSPISQANDNRLPAHLLGSGRGASAMFAMFTVDGSVVAGADSVRRRRGDAGSGHPDRRQIAGFKSETRIRHGSPR
jgi:hypothetical protein